MLQRQQDGADSGNDPMVRRLEPQGTGEFDLNSGSAPSAVTDVLRVDPAVLVASQARLDAARSDGSANLLPQCAIQPAEQNLGRIPATAVYSDDMIAAGEELKTPWLVEPVTCQMEPRVIARSTQAFEQIQVEF